VALRSERSSRRGLHGIGYRFRGAPAAWFYQFPKIRAALPAMSWYRLLAASLRSGFPD
jgi:hypothetical protein